MAPPTPASSASTSTSSTPTGPVSQFDYILLSAGHWFYRPAVFYRIVGCHYCLLPNVPDLGMYYGYRMAFRTAIKAINSLKDYEGITYLRTLAPSHFEGGPWNEGKNCVRRRPFRSNETVLEGPSMEFYTSQVEEFMKGKIEGRLLDTTQAMLLSPDGHPRLVFSGIGHMRM